jgi:hypothetical protein
MYASNARRLENARLFLLVEKNLTYYFKKSGQTANQPTRKNIPLAA